MNQRVVQSPWTNRLLLLVAMLLSVIVVQNFHFTEDNHANEGQVVTVPSFGSYPVKENMVPNFLLLRSPEPMPSVKTTSEEESRLSAKRKKYGGAGDKQHLGNPHYVNTYPP